MSDATNWESVPLRGLFSFERGKEKNMALLKEGDLPLVSARNVNNGVKGFVGNPRNSICFQCFNSIIFRIGIPAICCSNRFFTP